MTLQEIKKKCKKYNIYPKKSKGQNFLLCDDALDKAVLASDIKKGETVLEVGPGFGFLTKKLAEKDCKVISVELDDKLYEVAQIELKNFKNVEIINSDILKLSDDYILKLTGGRYKITANLPYNISGKFLRKFLSMELKPNLIVLMLQKEVAERICALPGNMSLLAVSAQYYSKPEIISNVQRGCFYPAPEVDSAIIRLNIKEEREGKDEQKKFFQIVRIGFSARRKMLKNNLYNGFNGMGKEIDMADVEAILLKCGLSVKARAEDLCVADWKRLVRVW